MLFGLFFTKDEEGNSLFNDARRAIELFGGVFSSVEEAITNECIANDLDPTNSKHRALVEASVEDEDNILYYLEEGTPMDSKLEFYETGSGLPPSGWVGIVSSIKIIEEFTTYAELKCHMEEYNMEEVEQLRQKYGNGMVPEWCLIDDRH